MAPLPPPPQRPPPKHHAAAPAPARNHTSTGITRNADTPPASTDTTAYAPTSPAPAPGAPPPRQADRVTSATRPRIPAAPRPCLPPGRPPLLARARWRRRHRRRRGRRPRITPPPRPPPTSHALLLRAKAQRERRSMGGQHLGGQTTRASRRRPGSRRQATPFLSERKLSEKQAAWAASISEAKQQGQLGAAQPHRPGHQAQRGHTAGIDRHHRIGGSRRRAGQEQAQLRPRRLRHPHRAPRLRDRPTG
jgi:hypothetical protein